MKAEVDNYIPLEKCKNGGLYKLTSRNLTLGVFSKADDGFYGIREKFKQRYILAEFHWDQGPPYGTAYPIEYVEMTSFKKLGEDFDIGGDPKKRKELFDFLDKR